MELNYENSDLIESYLRGDLSPMQQLAFEAKLDQDPLFKSEFQLQSDTISTIKSFRKDQLKSRLSNIDVSAPVGTVGGMSGFQIAASVAILAILTTASYFYFSDKTTKNNTVQVVSSIQNPENPKIDIIPEPAIVETLSSPAIQEPASEIVLDENTLVAANLPIPIKINTKIKKQDAPVSLNKETVQKEIEDDIVAPNVLKDFDSENIVKVENLKIPVAKLTENINDRSSEIDVAIEKTRSDEITYKFYNKKLYLIGNFTNDPYELIELNTNSGKNLFLYYNKYYYKLNENQKIAAPVQKIDDVILIHQLDNLRASKAE